MKISWDRVWRNKPREEDYLCWPRGNKAIIALWGSCKNLHYGAAAISGTIVQLYVLQLYVLLLYVLQLYVLQLYVLQQIYVVGSLGLLDFQSSSNVSPCSLPVSGWQQFPKCLYLHLVNPLINFTHIKSCQFFGGLFWQLSRKHLLVFENSNAFLTGSHRGGMDKRRAYSNTI